MASNFTDLKTKNMTKADFIEVLDKYDSDFTLETGEVIQAIYFYDFGKLADELVKLFAIHNVVEQSEQLKAFLDYVDGRYSEQGTRDKIVDEFLSL